MKGFLTALCAVLLLLPFDLDARKKSVQPEIPSQWNGRKVAYLGDSITDKDQVEAGVNDTYWVFLKDILGIEPLVYGINGHQSNQIIGQAERLLADYGQDFDAIMVFVGTNDFNASLPMGEWFMVNPEKTTVDGPVEVTRLHREFNFDPDTFKGRVNSMMLYLKTTFPEKQLILLTPIHRAYACFGPGNIQPDESFANAEGLFIDDYVTAIKELANIWSVPVVDLNSECGLMPTLDQHHQYFRGNDGNDYLHPNTKGHRRMAYALAYHLLHYPAAF